MERLESAAEQIGAPLGGGSRVFEEEYVDEGQLELVASAGQDGTLRRRPGGRGDIEEDRFIEAAIGQHVHEIDLHDFDPCRRRDPLEEPARREHIVAGGRGQDIRHARLTSARDVVGSGDEDRIDFAALAEDVEGEIPERVDLSERREVLTRLADDRPIAGELVDIDFDEVDRDAGLDRHAHRGDLRPEDDGVDEEVGEAPVREGGPGGNDEIVDFHLCGGRTGHEHERSHQSRAKKFS